MSPFPHYLDTRVHDLDGIWQAAWLGDVDPDQVAIEAIDWHERLPVPGCFDALPRYAGRRGLMAYRTVVTVTPGRGGLLRFGGGGLWYRVLVDGQVLGSCDLPYSGWQVTVPASDRHCRQVVVLVDNRFDAERVPLFHPMYDFYGYGGLYRSVSWREVGDWWIERVQVRPTTAQGGAVELQVRFGGAVPASVPLQLAFDHGALQELGPQTVTDGSCTLSATVPEPRRWSPPDPQLHRLRLQTPAGGIVERFGLRQVTVDGQRILLDGQPIRLLGYNRHEVHPQSGPALPRQQLVEDLQILQDLGCNCIRGSHYPQDQTFLDLCDEYGFLVWEETLGWGYDETQWRQPRFAPANHEQARLMVRNSFNHPSVILWGFFNEGGSHLTETGPLYHELATVLRAEDPTRLLTYASNRLWEQSGDAHLDCIDVVSLNMYPGWYADPAQGSRPLADVVPCLRGAWQTLAELGAGNKPLIISEIGAGAIYGCRDRHAAHWSEEYQRDFLALTCAEIIGQERYAGLTIWQYCDGRTYDDGRALGRPRAFNNKGTLDEYRRPKLAYDAVRQRFRAAAVGQRPR